MNQLPQKLLVFRFFFFLLECFGEPSISHTGPHSHTHRETHRHTCRHTQTNTRHVCFFYIIIVVDNDPCLFAKLSAWCRFPIGSLRKQRMKIPLPQSSNHDSVLPTLCQSVIWKIHAILPLKSSVGKKSHFENIQLCPSHSMKTFISSSTFISPFFMIFSIVGLCFLDDCLFVCSPVMTVMALYAQHHTKNTTVPYERQ